MKVCLACSAGGHLTEMTQLKKVYGKHKHFFLTFKRKDSEYLATKECVYFVRDTGRNILNSLINFCQSLGIFLKERPDVIISTGAGVAVPTCFLAKLFGKKLIFIESFCKVEKPSATGKLLYPITDLFIVQWKALLRFYPRAKHGGTIL